MLDNPDISIGEVLKQITDELKQPVYDAEHDKYIRTKIQGDIRQSDEPISIDFEELCEKTEEIGAVEIKEVKSAQEIVAEFRAKTEKLFESAHAGGETPGSIEAAVRNLVQDIIEEYGMDARIEEVIVSGSRCRGLETEESDLDVVVSFSGTEREDDLFNVLHEDGLFIGGVRLDVNPISTEQTGALSEYLKGAEKFLEEKAVKMEQDKVIPFPEPKEPKQVVTFTVAESSEFHSFGELHEGIPTLQDAMEIYEKLKHESSLNAIPALGINVHTVGTQAYEDMQWDFMSGGRLDLSGLMYLPEMSQNAEVIEALHQMADKYPEAEIIGRFPDEPEQDAFGSTGQKTEELTAQSLAEQLNQFAYDYDLYEYRDAVDDPEAHIAMLKNDIETGDTKEIKSFLQEIVDQEDGLPEDIEKAKELLQKLSEYKPLAKVEEREEQNYNMIDNVLNNLPQDPEEKKEPAPQKEMRVAEIKKVRKRVSMKEKLAEKKAEVAERDKKPPMQGTPTKRQGMGVDD